MIDPRLQLLEDAKQQYERYLDINDIRHLLPKPDKSTQAPPRDWNSPLGLTLDGEPSTTTLEVGGSMSDAQPSSVPVPRRETTNG